jgi:hypothetical protein
MQDRRKIFMAGGILLAFILILIAAGIVLDAAYADSSFAFRVKSDLKADYSGEKAGGFLGAFKLSIISDALTDLGLSPGDAGEAQTALEVAMLDPVPTATARNFAGDPPYTATPGPTKPPKETDTPDPTKTDVPTRKYTATPTATKTKSPAVTKAPSDSAAPVIADPGTLSPSLGALSTCTLSIRADDVQVTDASPSSGIKKVRLKYKVYDDTFDTIYLGYVYSNPMTLCSGGFTADDGWDACYDLLTPLTVKIEPGFSSKPDYTGPGPFKVRVWVVAEDNAGKEGYYEYGYYTMPHACDDPAPSPTPVTSTNTSTPTTTATPTISPTSPASTEES